METKISPSTIYDVIIVGAGPCGLAVASRLCEQTPSAIFTDEEHQRYHWIRKHGNKMTIKNWRNGNLSLAKTGTTTEKQSSKHSMLVLDETGDKWLSRWNTLFKMFNIDHLRSPMFFHIDPGDRDALLAYSYETGRELELQEIRGCVGKEISKHRRKKSLSCRCQQSFFEPGVDERDRKDYFTPSTSLFAAHCDSVVKRYNLDKGLIQNEAVQDITYGYSDILPDNTSQLFTVNTDKNTYIAKVVVLAVGPANAPSIPPTITASGNHNNPRGECHSAHIRQFPSDNVVEKIRSRKVTNVMVVGGGLTSAQIATLALKRGVTKVWHLMRGPLKLKPFDIDLPWLGKFRNFEQAAFYSADTDEERLQQIKEARGGGSITPRYYKLMKQHMVTGRISLHLNTVIHSKVYDPLSQTWSIKAEPEIPDLPPMDYIYFATGIQTDFKTLPYLKNIYEEYPIPGIDGLPCLTDDMMWREDVPLFVTGRLASLRLGPGAPNLVGARVGAERLAWSIEEILQKRDSAGDSDSAGEDHYNNEFAYCTGRSNKFESLEAC